MDYKLLAILIEPLLNINRLLFNQIMIFWGNYVDKARPRFKSIRSDSVSFGWVISTGDVIIFQGLTVAEIKKAFKESIEDYLAYFQSCWKTD